jgi:hypothetical protein
MGQRQHRTQRRSCSLRQPHLPAPLDLHRKTWGLKRQRALAQVVPQRAVPGGGEAPDDRLSSFLQRDRASPLPIWLATAPAATRCGPDPEADLSEAWRNWSVTRAESHAGPRLPMHTCRTPPRRAYRTPRGALAAGARPRRILGPERIRWTGPSSQATSGAEAPRGCRPRLRRHPRPRLRPTKGPRPSPPYTTCCRTGAAMSRWWSPMPRGSSSGCSTRLTACRSGTRQANVCLLERAATKGRPDNQTDHHNRCDAISLLFQ